MDKLTQHALEAAKDYLRGNGPWKDGEIGITEDDYLVQCFAKAIRAAEQRLIERLQFIDANDAQIVLTELQTDGWEGLSIEDVKNFGAAFAYAIRQASKEQAI